MSLYNMLHGYEPTANFVLSVLNIPPTEIPRFRDAYLTYLDETKSEPVMVILTRTGGGNRDAFENEILQLQQLPGYLDSTDDEFDSTFALFRYKLPEHLQPEILEFLSEHGPPLTLREKTNQATGPDQTRRQKRTTEAIAEQLLGSVGKILKP